MKETRRGAGRPALNRQRVLEAAVALADREGIEPLTMRRLGEQLGVEAMSLYNHVANKDDVLDGMVDLVVAEIEVPGEGTDWRGAMRRRAVSAHEVLLAHPWAATQITSRFNIGPGMMAYLDATLGRLLDGGFTVAGALDAWNVLDSHVYGFTLQELGLPFEASESSSVSTDVLSGFPVDEFPHLARVLSEIAGAGREEDFAFGLELILEGLEPDLASG